MKTWSHPTSNSNVLFLSGSFVTGTDWEDAVCINVKFDFSLWNSTWCRWDTIQAEAAKRFIIPDKLYISQHLSVHLAAVENTCDLEVGSVVFLGRQQKGTDTLCTNGGS